MKEEQIKLLKINQSKWENIAGFLIPWFQAKNKHTIQEYYDLHKFKAKKIKEKLPFTLLEVICMLMFMSNEQIVVYDNSWKHITFTCEYVSEYDEYEPLGYKIIPKIYTGGSDGQKN